MPRPEPQDHAYVERPRWPNPYAAMERSRVLSLAARNRTHAGEKHDPSPACGSRRSTSPTSSAVALMATARSSCIPIAITLRKQSPHLRTPLRVPRFGELRVHRMAAGERLAAHERRWIYRSPPPASTLIRSGKLRYAKAESMRLLAWMYYAPAVPCLYRKRTKAEGFLSSLRKAAGHPTGRPRIGRLYNGISHD